MDYNDSWEVTIVPSVTSQTTSSNDTIALSTRALSTISERESKDFCLPFDGNKRKKDTYKNAERSKITSLAPTCQKLNHDYSHCSFKSDKQLTSILQRNKKESYDKINKKDIHSQTCEDMNNASDQSDALFIELGAVYKILDFITDSNPKVSTLTNDCCNEISQTLQCLLAQRHDKKLEDLLLKDSSLHRCERCGVISYILESHPTTEKIKKNRAKIKHDNEIIIAERDYINDQNNEKLEISISPPNLINNAELRINDSKINNQTEYKDELSERELLSTNKRALLMKSCIKSSNEVNMSITKADINNTIKNKFYPGNNTIKKLCTDLETENKNKRYECNRVTQNNPGKYQSSNAMKDYASTGKEEVVREILYEPKSQIDELLARDRRSSFAQTIKVSQRTLDKHGDIYPIVDIVKYLARGQSTELDRKEDELFSKLQERRYLDNARNGGSSVLYGSREDYPQSGAGFWLFDESGHLFKIPLDDCLPIPRIDDNRVNVSANISRYSYTTEKMKVGNQSNYMEKDSLEDCTLLKQREESNVTILSSSSVENLIHGSLDRKYEINGEDISRGRKLVSSRPSLNIARHVRAQIAKDRRSGKAKESIGEPCTHDSHILVRLSPETRRKICHLIKTIISSDKDSTFFHKKYLSNKTLNSEKLLHSKSADAAFAHSNKCYKIDNEKTNICADDCIPTKLSELPEDKNRLLRRQNNFVNIRNQYLNESLSKDSVKIFHDDTTLVSSDKCADNSKKKIVRQIVYKDAALKNITENDDGHREILLFYRKILEKSEDMDWENFREFVEVLHPDERELWRDVCKTISEETKRIGGNAYDNTEICIEISAVNPEETLKAGKVMMCAQEIVFELDMTLKNVENFLDKRLAKERLDTHKDTEDVMNWSSRRWETILKQTR